MFLSAALKPHASHISVGKIVKKTWGREIPVCAYQILKMKGCSYLGVAPCICLWLCQRWRVWEYCWVCNQDHSKIWPQFLIFMNCSWGAGVCRVGQTSCWASRFGMQTLLTCPSWEYWEWVLAMVGCVFPHSLFPFIYRCLIGWEVS